MLSSWALACSLAWSRARASSVARLTQTLGRRISIGGAGVGVASRDCKPLLFPFPKATPVHSVLRRAFGRRSRAFLDPCILSTVCVQTYKQQTTVLWKHASLRMRRRPRTRKLFISQNGHLSSEKLSKIHYRVCQVPD